MQLRSVKRLMIPRFVLFFKGGLLIRKKKSAEEIQIHENFQTIQKTIFRNKLNSYENELF